MKNIIHKLLSGGVTPFLVITACLILNTDYLSLHAQSIIYVNHAATGANDGTSWTDAYTDLQSAFGAATKGDIIWVAAGTYKPTGTTDQSISFELMDSVAVYGGFAGTESSLDERNYSTNTTTLSGEINTGSITDNTRHVVMGANHARLDGFTVTLGYGDDATGKGGGLLNDTVSYMKVYNCIFTGNRAPQGGGAANNYCGDSVVFYGCSFSENIATNGGGLANFACQVFTTNCTFRDNSLVSTWGTERYGGGMYNWGSTPSARITNCTFYGNSAVEGGAIHNRSVTSTVINCILWGNSATTGKDIANSAAGGCNVSYSCIEQDGYAGENGNISENPLFNDADNGDFRLNGASPCIDTGDPFSPKDSDGTRANMGAYYSVYKHPLDAAIYEIVEPESPFQYGFNEVKVTFKNYGTTTLTSLNIDWEVDGNSQTTYNWSGSVASGEISDTLTLGSYDFDFNIHTITAWTSAPNGSTDDYQDNDTTEVSVNGCNPLTGIYTIGSGGNYTTFSAAVSALTNGCGISGPVTFLVKEGTYNEQIVIPEIPGVSEEDTIVFRSETGDTADVTLSYNAGASNIYTVKLDGADHITFMNITLAALSTSYGRVVEISGDARNNRFTGNQFIGQTTTNESENMALVYSPGEYIDLNNIFEGNLFKNGSFGIYWRGDGNDRDSVSIEVIGNRFQDQSEAAMDLWDIKTPVISGNCIRGKSTDPSVIYDYGIRINQVYGFPGHEALISNNFIFFEMQYSNNYYFPLYITNAGHFDIFHNNISITKIPGNLYNYIFDPLKTGSVDHFRIMNNIFVNLVYDNFINCEAEDDFQSDYNNFYGGEGVFDLAAWQASSGQDAHSLSLDPRFVASDDLHVAHPFLNGAGTPLDRVTTDIDGEHRDPANPDIGADEFEPGPAMAGTYTINPAGGDFNSFTEAVDTMYHNSLAGPVIFDVADGIYNEQIHIHDIPGSSETNTITFRSASADSTAVTLTFDADDAGNNYTVKLDGMQAVTFRDMTLSATDPVFSRVVAMTNAPSGNRIIGVPGSSELIWSDATSDSNNVYAGNVFSGGDYGLYLEGKNYDQAGSPAGTEITGNYFQDQAESAIYLKFHKQSLVESNLIESDSTCTGISLFYPFDFFTVSKNRIFLYNSGNGIESSYGTYSDTSLISNNHIFIYDTLGANGIYINSDFARLRIMHNSVHISGRSTGSNALHIYYMCNPYIELYNNILSNRAFGRAIQNRVDKSDCNDLFTNGEYLAYTEKTLEKWQTTYNLDTNSVSAPPYFYPDTSYLCFNPLLNNAGTPLDEVSDDIEGESRDLLTPDIGADEFDLAGAPLSGNYTIGTSGDYLDFSGAVADLAGRGISGAVNFEVKTGTYNEQVFIPEVAGASETNTITFRSESGDSSDVLLTFSPLGINSRLKSVLMLDGTDHLILEHISISTGEDFGWPLYLSGEATGNVISNNRLFYGKTTSANVIDRALIYSSGSLDNNNLFTFNQLENAPVGMAILASSTGDSITGTRIRNNVFRNIGYRAIRLSSNDDFEISGNDVEVEEGTYNYGISTDNSRGMVFNNFVRLATTNGGKGIYLTGADYAVYHNTVKITGSASNSESLSLSASGSISMNNVLVNLAGGFSASYDTTELNSDYNLYYTTQSIMITATGSINSSDIEEWQTESSGRDLHSISREPQFLADTNLHTTDPWLNNIGTPLAEVTTDIDREPRDPAHPDPGADEFAGIMPFAGEYTIGPSGDFATFTDAVDTIAPVGLMGPVTFIVESGTYNEQFVIPEIPETSETNTVTFKSASGDSTDVILGFKATISENYTVKLDGAKYITFQDMTIKALDTAYTRVVEFANGSSYNVMANNVIVGAGTQNAAIFSIGSNDNNNIFENNLIRDGKIGIQMIGESSSSREAGTQIEGNTFDNQVSSSIYLTNQDVPIVLNNRIIHGQLNETSWAGIYLENVYGKWDTLGLIANNAIHVYTNYTAHGISIKSSNYLRFYHNSVHITGNADESRALHHESGNNIHLTNNIFSNTAGGLALVTYNSGGLTSDYNDLYTDGNRFIYTDTWVNDLLTWQNTYGKDPYSLSVDPMFYADTNLHVYQPLLNGSGIPLAVIDRDMDGESRDPLAPDIGADEFTEAYFILTMEDTTICNNTRIEIDAGAGFDSYLWNTGETTQIITVDTTGVDQVYYRVTVTHNTYDYMDSVLVTFTGPEVNLGLDTSYCTDGSILLDAGAGSFTYLWSDMSTGQTLSVSTTGQYSVKITDTYGCTDEDTVNITLNPLPHVTIITETDAFRINDPSITTYQWYMDNNIIDMATAGIYNPVQSGDYFVYVTDGNNCTNYSDTVHFEISSVETLTGNGLIDIYPNPATISLFIRFTGVTSPAKLQIINIVGSVVYTEEIEDPAHQPETRLDLSGLSQGTYFVVVRIDDQRFVRKIVVEE